MDPLLFLGFLSATLLIVATPGPSVALASSQAVRFGPRAALVTVAGDALGSVVQIIIATAGLSLLVGLSDIILPYLQIAGGLFLLYLSYKALEARPAAPSDTKASSGVPSSFFTGFFTCVTNPKSIVFFVALFPGFISENHGVALQSLVYGAFFVVLDAAFILGYALLAVHVFKRTLGSRVSVERLSGFGLFGVGVVLVNKGWHALPQ